MRAQVGIEVMGVVGFVFLILIPLLTGFYTYSSDFWERLAIEKADAAAERIANAVDMVGPQGDAMLVQEIVVPKNVEKIKVDGREIVFTLVTSSGATDIVKATSYEVRGDIGILREGSYYIKAEAKRGIVYLELGE
ncbi:MAG: hypothetical protein ABIG39_07815 [Candidatus Micrarchaeota archaeon]